MGQGNLTINAGGVLVVTGNLTTTNGLNAFTNNGSVVVEGSMTDTNGTITNNDSNFYVFGSTTVAAGGGGSINGCNAYTGCNPATAANIGNQTSLQNNNPALSGFVGSCASISPAGKTICSGSNTGTLTASGGSGGTITYQWQKSTTSSTTGFAPISGATSSTYSATGLTATTWYKVVVTSPNCSSTSSAVQFTVSSVGGWIGTTNTDWSTTTNWCGGTLPLSTTNVVIPTGLTNYPVISSTSTPATTTANCNDLQIQTGASVTLSGTNNSLNIYGNFTNNGTLSISTTNANTVSFLGTAQQTVSGTGTLPAFYNLTVNNSAGVVFSSNVAVNNTLTLTAGIVNLSNNTLTLGTSATAAGTLSISTTVPSTPTVGIMNGTFKRWIPKATITVGNAAGYFPMVTSTYVRPFFHSRTNYCPNYWRHIVRYRNSCHNNYDS